jgi:uncharacterized protein YjiS (DUF1127 family)
MQIRLSCIAALSLFRQTSAHYVPCKRSNRIRLNPAKYKENQMFASIVRFLQSWRRYNRSLSELNRLADRELADIGISRSDIPRVAWSASQQG